MSINNYMGKIDEDYSGTTTPNHDSPSSNKEEAIKLLKRQIGDTFNIVEPVYDLWVSKNNTLYVQFKRYRYDFIEKLRRSDFIESVQEAGGNNVMRVVVKLSNLLNN